MYAILLCTTFIILAFTQYNLFIFRLSIPFPLAENLDCTLPVLEGSKSLTVTLVDCSWDWVGGTVSWSA